MKFDMHCHTKEGSMDGKVSGKFSLKNGVFRQFLFFVPVFTVFFLL